MADQKPKIMSKRQILQLEPPRLCLKTLMVGLFMLAWSICSVLAASCPSSVPSSTATTTERCSFTGYSSTQTYGVAVGSVSSSIYYLYFISTPNSTVVRKVDVFGSQTWMVSFAALYPTVKGMSVDAAEQSMYLASHTNPVVVIKLAASTGSIVSQHQL